MYRIPTHPRSSALAACCLFALVWQAIPVHAQYVPKQYRHRTCGGYPVTWVLSNNNPNDEHEASFAQALVPDPVTGILPPDPPRDIILIPRNNRAKWVVWLGPGDRLCNEGRNSVHLLAVRNTEAYTGPEAPEENQIIDLSQTIAWGGSNPGSYLRCYHHCTMYGGSANDVFEVYGNVRAKFWGMAGDDYMMVWRGIQTRNNAFLDYDPVTQPYVRGGKFRGGTGQDAIYIVDGLSNPQDVITGMEFFIR